MGDAQMPGAVVEGGVSRYRLEEEIGRGGSGEVFRARDTQLHRDVAIKRLHGGLTDSADERSEMLREARHLAALQHPNIVTVHDVLEDGGDMLVVMELLRGRTLQDVAEKAPLLTADFCELMRQTLEGLIAAHALGMLHRDIKPGNIMVLDLPSGAFQIKILDFGLSKIAAGPSVQTIKEDGSLLGTIFTMSPEQLEGGALDVRSDLYALGCVAYFALCSSFPFRGETVPQVIAAHLRHRVYPLDALRPDVPSALCEWVMRLLAREPDARPASAADALEQLKALVPSTSSVPLTPAASPSAAPARGFPVVWAALGGLALVVAGAGFLLFRPAPRPAEPTVPPVAATPPPAAPSPTVPAAPPVYSPRDTEGIMAQLGRTIEVTGRIARDGVSKSGALRFLNFEGTQRGDLTLVFFVKDNPMDFTAEKLSQFIGKSVRVQGKVTQFEGTPQIVVTALDQLEPL